MKNVSGFAAVIERLKIALKVESTGQVADFLGIKRNAFYNRKTSGSLPWEDIIRVCLGQGISIDWVATGEGAPYEGGVPFVAPVTEIPAGLLPEIEGALFTAFSSNDGIVDKAELEKVLTRAELAAQIFNDVAFIKNEKTRSKKIRDHVAGMAIVVRLYRGRAGSP